jgi:hypothetical protein
MSNCNTALLASTIQRQSEISIVPLHSWKQEVLIRPNPPLKDWIIERVVARSSALSCH